MQTHWDEQAKRRSYSGGDMFVGHVGYSFCHTSRHILQPYLVTNVQNWPALCNEQIFESQLLSERLYCDLMILFIGLFKAFFLPVCVHPLEIRTKMTHLLKLIYWIPRILLCWLLNILKIMSQKQFSSFPHLFDLSWIVFSCLWKIWTF